VDGEMSSWSPLKDESDKALNDDMRRTAAVPPLDPGR